MKFFENFDLFGLPSFSPKIFLKLLSDARTFHSAFLFQIRKHISDAMCHAMYDYAWMKCLFIRFTFMIFSFIKIATFSPMHTLRACWCSLFLFYLRRYFYIDACLLHRISFFALGNKATLVQAFTHETQGFPSLCYRLHNSRIVNKFRMNNEKCNAINLIMRQNKTHNVLAKG